MMALAPSFSASAIMVATAAPSVLDHLRIFGDLAPHQAAQAGQDILAQVNGLDPGALDHSQYLVLGAQVRCCQQHKYHLRLILTLCEDPPCQVKAGQGKEK